MEFKDCIQKLRKEKNMTQNELAEKLFISFQAVSQWENGNTKPDIELLPKIAKIFDVSIDELFGIEKKLYNSDISFKNCKDDTLYVVIASGLELKNVIDLNEVKRFDDSITVNLNGKVLNVKSSVNVKCEGVQGDVTAGLSVTCDGVEGNVTAGLSVTCDDINGNVTAGSNITCDDINGNVTSGSNITCDDITGDVTSSSSVVCDTINGDVYTNGSIECEVIEGNIIKK